MEITGNFGNYTSHNGLWLSGDGAFSRTSWGTTYYIDEGRAINNLGINFKASRSWTGSTSEEGGDEARPCNLTIRIWKRTA